MVPMRLDCYRSNITSQHGENGIIAYLLSAYPNIAKVCLEVGASDGVTNSNTYPLWVAGWQALLIEGNPGLYRKLHARSSDFNVTAVNALIEPTGKNSLDAIAKRNCLPEIGVASIDIDSCDYWIFAHMQMRPAVVIVECNADFPILVSYRDPEGTSLLRHSARAVAELGTGKGYRAIACTGPNLFLVREDVIATNPSAVPNLPLYALEDREYAARRSRWIVGAKPITYRPIYKVPPPPPLRAYFWMRFVGLTARAALRGRPARFARIGMEERDRLRRSGLAT
jgi:hypothetical protein